MMESMENSFELGESLHKCSLPDVERSLTVGESMFSQQSVSTSPGQQSFKRDNSSDPVGRKAVRSSTRSLSDLKKEQEKLRDGLLRQKMFNDDSEKASVQYDSRRASISQARPSVEQVSFESILGFERESTDVNQYMSEGGAGSPFKIALQLLFTPARRRGGQRKRRSSNLL
eukprot:CAMPEP_0185855118 /NCGR_PEP_ID=MMETSP1354-20130828/24676_1 /TAXON_ID=708628 /ORGANISM="Erythrolobus madagascarensis, Strain CCMP3276" /LENGTH=171 /DNA_ID=CAMNT_0028557067 /DNA_START=149 /DNA_END=664 /DNA_ORIENTATION=-